MTYSGKISELKDVVKFFFRKDNKAYSNQLEGIDPYVKIDYNVYESGPTMGEYVEEQIRTHSYLKWRVFYPLMWLGNFVKRYKIMLTKPITWFAKKQLGKYYNRPYPKHSGFTKIIIVDRAFELALMDFSWYVLAYKEKGDKVDEKDFVRNYNSASVKQMRELKNIVMHIVKNDTAYIDFMNMFALRVATEMNKKYPSSVAHTIYTSNRITDFAYFHASLAGDKLSLDEIRAIPTAGVTFNTRNGTQNNETTN